MIGFQQAKHRFTDPVDALAGIDSGPDLLKIGWYKFENVPTNDVRALAGSVEEKRATAGLLVTTAWVSPETKAFAARNNRLEAQHHSPAQG